MDRITLIELEEWQRARRTFTLLDVRRAKVRAADAAEIAGSEWRSPDGLFTWKDEIVRDRPVVVVCAHGHELSQGAAATLRAMGLDARYLVDGFAGWRDSGRPTVPAASDGGAAMKWITRERPKIDRIACPWLIARFIDDAAGVSLFVPAQDVLAESRAHRRDPLRRARASN